MKEAALRKQNIIDVATNLLTTNGTSATSLLDIARTAGVSAGTVYQHFGSKEEIFKTVLYSWISQKSEALPVLSSDDSLYDSVLAIARYIQNLSETPSANDNLRLTISESSRFPDFCQRILTGVFRKTQSNVEALFKQLSDFGRIRDEDHDISAQILIDFILGNQLILNIMDWNTAIDVQNIEEKVSIFVEGYMSDLAA